MINRERIKGFVAGILATLGTWMIVITLYDDLLSLLPIKNKYIIGIVLVIIGGYLGGKK